MLTPSISHSLSVKAVDITAFIDVVVIAVSFVAVVITITVSVETFDKAAFIDDVDIAASINAVDIAHLQFAVRNLNKR